MAVMQNLYALEASGKYVFHGSASGDINELAPRQAKSFGKNDGEPAVFASDKVDPSIFMAVIGSKKTGGWNSNGEDFGFYLDRDSWEKAKKEAWAGFVYVLERHDFRHDLGFTWRAITAVKPVEVIPVFLKDLPEFRILSDAEDAEIKQKYNEN